MNHEWMGKIYPKHVILLGLFLLVLFVRLIIAFQTPNFTGDDAYFSLRQIEHIRQTGTPLLTDDLSYGGRTFIVLPFGYYVFSLFSIFLPLAFVAKLLPNVLASSIIFIIYAISKRIK